MSDFVNSFPKQLNRRELGKMTLAGVLEATQLDWSRSGFAQEQTSSPAVRPQSPGLKLSCICSSAATDEDLLFYKQLGVDGLHLNGMKPEDFTLEGLLRIKKRFADAGFYTGIMPTPVNDLTGDILLNRPGRDKAIEVYRAWIHTLASAGFDYFPCLFNLNGPASTGLAEARGSRARDFDLNGSEIREQGYVIGSDSQVRYAENALGAQGGFKGPANALLYGREYSKDEIWANYTHFIKQVAPVAEEAGVKIGFHPDDPPTPSLFGVAHIFANFDDYKKALKIANSPNIGLCLCCGTWEEGGAAMGIDTAGAIRYFGSQKKIFEIHFRNVSSTLPHFHETYPDDGYYDQYKVMKALMDVKYDGYVQLDHIVPMVGGLRTYEAFAVGYMRALAQRAQAEDAA